MSIRMVTEGSIEIMVERGKEAIKRIKESVDNLHIQDKCDKMKMHLKKVYSTRESLIARQIRAVIVFLL